MKKSIIWVLTIVMSLTFGILLYFQILYLEKMVKMRREQFSENVMRAMYGTSAYLEREETLFYLEQEAAGTEFINPYNQTVPINTSDKNENGDDFNEGSMQFSINQKISERYKMLQDALLTRYRYQQGLLNEIILIIMQESGQRPVMERADSTVVRKALTAELGKAGLKVPFAFGVSSMDGKLLYSSQDFSNNNQDKVYSIVLFPNSDVSYNLLVTFPTENSYIFSSVRFIIPTLAFTVVLLVVFLLTILLAFRQKKLSEMKNNFINNMTHEIKTPITAISLAAQMLNDSSINKTPNMLSHLSRVITTESKRLRMLVERVLLLSMFDNSQLNVNLKEVKVNEVIENTASNFKIRSEKEGGTIECALNASNDIIIADPMHFTNVVYNLLDNALKYRKPDVPSQIFIETKNISEKNLIEIKVSDNGQGIKKEDQKRVFDRFYRVPTGNRHDEKGFGIGLAYVRQIITQMGGNIRIESEFGKGTTFVITIPVVPEEIQGSSD